MKTLAEHLFGIEAGTTHRAHALDSDIDSGAYLARETARAVMDQDAPLFVCEADDQFLVSGEDTAVLINPDGGVSIRSKDNQGKVSDSNMNYEEQDELFEQQGGPVGPPHTPGPGRRRKGRPNASKKNYFEDGFDEGDLDEAKGSALNVAKNALGVTAMTQQSTVARLKKEAKPDAQGRLRGSTQAVRNANFFRVAQDALSTIVKSGDEKLAQAALSSSSEKHLDVRNMVGVLAQADAPGWRKKAKTYQGMVASLRESVDESQPHAGAQMHQSKRNKLTDPRGPQSETNPRDYPTDTSYGHGNPTPQFSEDWEISETEWLQFWLDEVVENAYTPDMRSVIQAIDAAVEEEDFETFDIEAARLAEMAGVLDEYKKMSGGSRAKMMKARKKPKTGKQKMALKKRRLKYKKNKSKMLRASRKYRQKNKARMASDDHVDNMTEGNLTEQPAGYGPDFKPIGGGSVGWGGSGGASNREQVARAKGGLSDIASLFGAMAKRSKKESAYYYDELSEQSGNGWGGGSVSLFGELTYQDAFETPIGDGGGIGWWGGIKVVPIKPPKDNPWLPTPEIRVFGGDPHPFPGSEPEVGAMFSLSWNF
jgi:hypothetical protein